jgi:hypothetical protein
MNNEIQDIQAKISFKKYLQKYDQTHYDKIIEQVPEFFEREFFAHCLK